eukprot:scaffold1049_cov152-Skeletonema_menzelii.AAC.10
MTAANPLEDGIDPDEVVYTSLIQTYLSLLCYDNAIFLAERLAAHCPTSENAVYLLAHCYYRSGSAKRARSVLLSKSTMEWNATNSSSINTVSAGGNDVTAIGGAGIELERTRSSARYLLAKCCFDLGNYGEAEEALLKHAREQFSKCIARGEVKIRGGNRNEAMDAWILNSSINKNEDTTSSSSCPIPNGAAGLNLLGNICRRSNRRHRAMEYYRLSLKLDPLMWTSYEALCELGGAKGSNVEEADDPKSIFGVDAPLLSPRGGEGAIMGTQHNFLPTGINASAASVAPATATPGQQSLHSFKLNRYGTPSTPYSTFDQMKIDTGTHPQLYNEAKQAVDLHQPATTSTIASRTRSRIELPQTKLFDSSVATTAQKATPMTATIDESAPTDSAIGYANEVLDRARRVVAGMTYEPSPESKSPSNMRFQSKSRKSVGFAESSKAATGDDLTFSQTPLPGTPNDAPAPFHAAVSSVKGEKRALFTTIDGGTAKRKSPKKDETKVDDDSAVGTVSEMTPGRERVDGAVNLLDGETENHHVSKVLQLLCCYGAAYKYLCQASNSSQSSFATQNRSEDALELFRELPLAQINTGWVQHQIGRAYLEMTDYQNAQRALENMQKIDPHRLKGLDILSTTYWQLKKEVELSDLAQKAVDFDKMAPEAWFVVGNCFSLQKEHETAITFFSRSIQLDPTYTYAYTLCGHEYTSNEDFEKAISCYRDAIRVDNRHYNAWYGLGAIYFRQEKFDLAEYHFQRALEINSQSSVLHCHLGMAQHQNGKTVRAAAPKEASVHFNMGKVYKRMGKPEKALRCFLTALDLDPKDNNLIKAAMDRLDEPDIEEEVSSSNDTCDGLAAHPPRFSCLIYAGYVLERQT